MPKKEEMMRRSQISLLDDPPLVCKELDIEQCCAVLPDSLCIKNKVINARNPCALNKKNPTGLTQSSLASALARSRNPDRVTEMRRCMGKWPHNWKDDDDGDDHNDNGAARALTEAEIEEGERQEAARQQAAYPVSRQRVPNGAETQLLAAARQQAEEEARHRAARQHAEEEARQRAARQRAANVARQQAEEEEYAREVARIDAYWKSPEGIAEKHRRSKAQAEKNANTIQKKATNSVARGFAGTVLDYTVWTLATSWSIAKGAAKGQSDLESFKRERKAAQAEWDRQLKIRNTLVSSINGTNNPDLVEELDKKFEATHANFEKISGELRAAAKKVKDEEAALEEKIRLAKKAAREAELKQYLSDKKKEIQERKLREMQAEGERLEKERIERERARLQENARLRAVREAALREREAERGREEEREAERNRMINSRAKSAHRATQAQLKAISRAKNAHRATVAELTAIHQAKQIELAAMAAAEEEMVPVQVALKNETKEQVSEVRERESGEAQITEDLQRLKQLATSSSLNASQEAEAVRLVRRVSNGISNSVSATQERHIEQAHAENTNSGSATAAARETPYNEEKTDEPKNTRKGGYSLKTGNLYDKKGRLMYSGELVDGVPHGKGTAYDVENGKGYKGKFKDGKML